MTGAANTVRGPGFPLYGCPLFRNGLQLRYRIRPQLQGTTHFLPPINLYGNCLERRKEDKRIIDCLCFISRSSEVVGGASCIIHRHTHTHTHTLLCLLYLLPRFSSKAWLSGCSALYFDVIPFLPETDGKVVSFYLKMEVKYSFERAHYSDGKYELKSNLVLHCRF
jgi:hypothetical protein